MVILPKSLTSGSLELIVLSTGREALHLLQNHEHPRFRHDQLHPYAGPMVV